ncbi:MAG: heavy metal-associated domain-containing protein [Mariprofundales bacterium]
MLILKYLFVGFLVFSPLTTALAADDGVLPTATIQVDGLSCPFCVYGLEKNLKKLNGVEQVDTNMTTGKAIVTLTGDPLVDDQTLRQAVKKAGFTARDITRP